MVAPRFAALYLHFFSSYVQFLGEATVITKPLTSLVQVQIEIKTFTHMSLVGITGFCVNTTILDDILKGIVH